MEQLQKAALELKSPLFLSESKSQIDALITSSLERFGENSPLREACVYALTSSGKRFRPAIVLMVGSALGEVDLSQTALGVEFFHTASLIADDLPCMDNDLSRREKASLHRAYGEDTAILASYGLIAAGYESLAKTAILIEKQHPLLFAAEPNRMAIAVEVASRCLGLSGATKGQYLDLHASSASLEVVKEIFYKKTATLFELSFLLGWIFGGGPLNRMPEVQQLALHFGLAFQLLDDLEDYESDLKKSHPINFAVLGGTSLVQQLFLEELELYRKLLIELEINTPQLEGLAELLKTKFDTQLKLSS